MTSAPRSLQLWSGGIAILLLALGLRVLPAAAARPYIAYVDEGNFLHPAVRMLRDGGWDPHYYGYAQLPVVAVKAVLCAWEPIYRFTHGHPLSRDLSGPPEVYDELEPFEVLMAARMLSAALGVLVVALTGLFAWRLADPAAGLAAAALAALVPALVLRGSIATVDSYAAVFVLGCLILAERSRSSVRPGLVCVLAGGMAGLAFASKYPAVIVLAAFGVTTLLEPLGGREKLRRLALAAGGLAVGALLGMPALVRHAREVYASIRVQGVFYAQIPSPSLAHQAFLAAEPNVLYERAELGFVFVALAAAGLVIGLRDHRLRPVFAGWLAFVGLALALYSRQFYQPFRNLVPLVPIGCIAAAIAFGRLRSRMTHSGWADALAITWLLAAFGIPLALHGEQRRRLVDSRVEALDWLTAHAQTGDTVLVARDLGFLKQELARLESPPTVRWWDEAAPAVETLTPRFLVVGILMKERGDPVDVAALPFVSAAYRLRARYGEKPTVPFRSWWRGNRQVVEILERKPPAPLATPRSP